MVRRRIGRHVGGGPEPEEERDERARLDRLREALSRWASGVTIVAVRDGERVHALTVSAFLPVSVSPPLVLVSLGPNASARPYLREGTRFVVSILRDDQRSLASRYADTFPVGSNPFPAEGAPVVAGALATLACVVEEILARGDHELVLGRVEEAEVGEAGAALTYLMRDYHSTG